MTSRLLAALFLLTICVGAVALAWPFDRTVATFTQPLGNISVGTRFGVRVGASTSSAVALLERIGLVRVSDSVNQQIRDCGGRHLGDAEQIIAFTDESWRKGVVCVFSHESKVIVMAWSFTPLAP